MHNKSTPKGATVSFELHAKQNENQDLKVNCSQ